MLALAIVMCVVVLRVLRAARVLPALLPATGVTNRLEEVVVVVVVDEEEEEEEYKKEEEEEEEEKDGDDGGEDNDVVREDILHTRCFSWCVHAEEGEGKTFTETFIGIIDVR